jgi:hypothetical protein
MPKDTTDKGLQGGDSLNNGMGPLDQLMRRAVAGARSFSEWALERTEGVARWFPAVWQP